MPSLVVRGSRNLPRTMCVQCSHVLAVIACCPWGRTLPRAMCGQCSHFIALSLESVGNPTLLLLLVPLPPCVSWPDVIVAIACDCRRIGPFFILHYRIDVRLMSARYYWLSSLVFVGDRIYFLPLSPRGMFISEASSPVNACYRLHVVAVATTTIVAPGSCLPVHDVTVGVAAAGP